MATREHSENIEVNYTPSWDLDGEAARDQTLNPPNSAVRHFATDRPVSSRQRNKPTLSCTACVNKKTKCDRLRPECHACRNRKTICEYRIPTKAKAKPKTRLNGETQMSQSPQRSRSRTTEPALQDDVVGIESYGQPPPSSGIIDFPVNDGPTMPFSSLSSNPNAHPDVWKPAAVSPISHLNPTGKEPLPTSVGTPTLLSTLRSFEQGSPTSFNLFRMTSQHPFRELRL